METSSFISLHGGHSGEFCCHARDRLEDIVQRYIELGFKRVGITEHMPPVSDPFLLPDEIAQGMTALSMFQRFARYMNEANRLKSVYRSQIRLHVGMETETYPGAIPHMEQLVRQFKPDYLVGSVHHVENICFDYSPETYEQTVLHCGSHERMYQQYFDLQYDMIQRVQPFVVGHFDLIRIHDPLYEQRLFEPKILEKIERNLALIKALGLVMDFNLRPLTRGEKEPYITRPLLQIVKKMGILVVPGDDSHGRDQAGIQVAKAMGILQELGFSTLWPEPRLLPLLPGP